LSPSIEIISTGAAWAASAKIEAMTKQRNTEKRRTTAFMRSAPQEILLGTDEADRTLNLKVTGERQ
jgi:hypothetical protein